MVPNPNMLGDGICHNFSNYNSAGCKFDGKDCDAFNTKYPGCKAELPSLLNNEKCDGGNYNSLECEWDGGDCDEFNERYPDCQVGKPFLVGNGRCDGDEYNTPQCDFDGGDCLDFAANFPDCIVEYPPWLGDGWCDGGEYNTADCNHDDGDCDAFNRNYPDCTVDIPYLVGDYNCDEEGGYNTPECGFDGGDCLFPSAYPSAPPSEDPSLRPTLAPSSSPTATPTVAPTRVPTNSPIANPTPLPTQNPTVTPTMALTGGPTLGTALPTAGFPYYPPPPSAAPHPLPTSHSPSSSPTLLPSGLPSENPSETPSLSPSASPSQNPSEYPTQLPSASPSLKPKPNVSSGNVTLNRLNYPNCEITVKYLSFVNNSRCDGGEYNTEICGRDGGDCEDFNNQYPDCLNVSLDELGDAICQHNTVGCNYDDGDCDDFNKQYPDCKVEKGYLIGDGYCNPEYNTAECVFDGGDCVNITDYGNVTFGGKFMTVDQYRSITKTYASIQISSSLISLISSIAIISIIWRSFKKLYVPFHRLLFGLSIADILSSTAQIFVTLPAANYYGIIWNAMGNRNTCRVQGFFIFWGSIAAPLYNCSICIYYLIMVTYKRSRNADAYIEGKIEFFFHAVPVFVPLIGAIVILSLDAFHPNLTYCFIEADPLSTNLEEFEISDRNAKVLFAVFSAGPYIVLPTVISVTMAIMYRAVVALEKRHQQRSPDLDGVLALRQKLKRNETGEEPNADAPITGQEGNNEESAFTRLRNLIMDKVSFCRSTDEGRRKIRSNSAERQKRAIANKALSFSLAFLVTYLFPIIISIRTLCGINSGNGLSILARIFFPLQGFFNFVVFIFPEVLVAKKAKRTGSISWLGAFLIAIKSRGRPLSNRHITLSSDGTQRSSIVEAMKNWLGRKKKRRSVKGRSNKRETKGTEGRLTSSTLKYEKLGESDGLEVANEVTKPLRSKRSKQTSSSNFASNNNASSELARSDVIGN